jgi:hypothetical protein
VPLSFADEFDAMLTAGLGPRVDDGVLGKTDPQIEAVIASQMTRGLMNATPSDDWTDPAEGIA